MLTLLIETSTERGAAFLFTNKELIFESYFPPGLHNSTDLMPAMQACLAKCHYSPADINVIGVGVGPGSYTGLRVGAMAAKMLSYALKIPLVGLCTLDCFASKQHNPYAVIIDAKMGGAYLQVDGGIPLVCQLNELPAHLQKTNVLVTPNGELLKKKLLSIYPDTHWCWENLPPDPYKMLGAAQAKFEAGQFTLDGTVELLYMRKTQAEIEKELKFGK